MDLSIVIVNWNTRAMLRQCLESIYANPPCGVFEVWVVDNASTDDSQAMVKEHFSQARLVENAQNVGFARANNLAIRQVHGRYVLLLNSDTIVKPGALESLVRFMDARDEAGACGSRLLNPDGTLQYSCYLKPTLWREFLRLFHLGSLRGDGSYPMANWPLDQAQEVDILQGAVMMLRRETLEQVGLLDEDFFMYSEDFDLCSRIQKENWKLYWVPWSEVIHFGGQSTKLVATDMFLHLYQSKLMFMRKHYGRSVANAYKFVLLVSALSRILLAPISLIEHPQARQRHQALSAYYRRLITSLPGM